MFSRFREAIENTLVEEQARHRAAQPQRQKSNAAASRAAKKPAQDDAPINNPAEFEKLFSVDDEDGDPTSRAVTPQPAAPTAAMTSSDTNTESSAAPSHNGDGAAASVSPEVQAKLNKLNKLETKYKDLLRSYRIAHGRVTAVEAFEKVLREHTPLANTKDPEAFVNYLNETNLQIDMIKEEIKRMAGENNDLQKRVDATNQELDALKDKKPAEPEDTQDEPKDDEIKSNQNDNKNDEEIRKLQAEKETQAQEYERVSKLLAEAQGDVKEFWNSAEESRRDAKTLLEKLQTSTEVNDSLTKKLNEAESERQRLKEDLEKEKALKEAKPADEEEDDAPDTLHPEAANTTAAKKKSKKKKKNKKGGASNGEPLVSTAPPSETSEQAPLASLDSSALEDHEAEVEKLKGEIADKNALIDELEKQRSIQAEDLKKKLAQKVDKIDSLEELYRSEAESLVDTRKDLAEARKKNQELSTQKVQLENDKAHLGTRIDALQKQARSGPDYQEKNTKLQKSLESMTGELKERNEKIQALEIENQSLKSKSQSLESELRASQKLAKERYDKCIQAIKLSENRGAELKILLEGAKAWETTKEQLEAKEKEFLAVSKQERESSLQLKRLQTSLTESEADAKALREQLNGEKATVAKLQKDLTNANRDRDQESAKMTELAAKHVQLVKDLELAKEEIFRLRAKFEKLEQENTQLRKDKSIAEERAEFKTKQVKSGEDLVASMRDQARELSIRLKETQEQCESLVEELEDLRRHLAERTREADSMRRLLGEENSRVDDQVREIQSRLDAAIDERDRAEDELSREGRRRTREIEDLKAKVRELEREAKTLSSQNDELEQREKDWAQRRQDLEQIEQKAAAADEEMRSTISNLQSALDKSEQEVRSAEKRCVELKKLLDDTRTRFEKLKTQQQQQQQQSRSSIDSNRTQNGSAPNVDVAYLKTVLLQFLELKGDMRPQMIPVLSQLLGFTADDNEKWMKATQQLSTKSGR